MAVTVSMSLCREVLSKTFVARFAGDAYFPVVFFTNPMMRPSELIKDDYRLTVEGSPKGRVRIDRYRSTIDMWLTEVRLRQQWIESAIKILMDGNLFVERLPIEDLVRDGGTKIESGEYTLWFRTYDGDNGFMLCGVDLMRLPRKGKPKLLAQLGYEKIPLVIELLREAVKMVEGR